MKAEITITQWNKMGDHPLVTNDTVEEFEYQEAKYNNAGFIDKWTIVYPGFYVLEVNGKFLSVIGPKKYKEIFES